MKNSLTLVVTLAICMAFCAVVAANPGWMMGPGGGHYYSGEAVCWTNGTCTHDDLCWCNGTCFADGTTCFGNGTCMFENEYRSNAVCYENGTCCSSGRCWDHVTCYNNGSCCGDGYCFGNSSWNNMQTRYGSGVAQSAQRTPGMEGELGIASIAVLYLLRRRFASGFMV